VPRSSLAPIKFSGKAGAQPGRITDQGDGVRVLQVGFGGDASRGDGVDECFVVAFVLVGVGGGEPGDGLVEDIGPAEVGRDGDPVA
jgi:hypothetical protein